MNTKMKSLGNSHKKILMAIVILIGIPVLVLVLFLNFSGILYSLNASIKKVIPDNPDISCNVDSDCILAIPSFVSVCSLCGTYGCEFFDAKDDNVVAINKDWKPRCLFTKPTKYVCVQCIGGIRTDGYEAECQNNQCIKVKK